MTPSDTDLDPRGLRFLAESNALEGIDNIDYSRMTPAELWAGHAGALRDAMGRARAGTMLTIPDVVAWQEAIVREQIAFGHPIEAEAVGKLRSPELPVNVRVANYVAPDFGAVPGLVEKLFDDIRRTLPDLIKKPRDTPASDFAGDVLQRFEAIHPFVDGNGRTGRLLVNYVLVVMGHPLMIFRASERHDFYAAHSSKKAMRLFLAEKLRDAIYWWSSFADAPEVWERTKRFDFSDQYESPDGTQRLVAECHELVKHINLLERELNPTSPVAFAQSFERPRPEPPHSPIRAQARTQPEVSAENARRQFGPYVVAGRGEPGCWSEVYRGIHPGRAAKVVLRVFSAPPDPAEVAQQLERLTGLVHPNIVRVLAAGVSSDSAYAALEPWKDGLKSVLRRTNEPLATRIALVEGICAGLAAAHQAGVTHGDLGLEHVRIGLDDRPRIDLSDRRPSTMDGRPRAGLPGLSPEQIRGLPADARTDVFTASAVSYEILTGHRPFDGDTLPSVLFSVMSGEPRPLDIGPELSEPMRAWLLRGLAKDPGQRFQNGHDMWEALAGIARRTVGACNGLQGEGQSG
jgi:hypothetical protein